MMVIAPLILLLCNAVFIDAGGVGYGHTWDYKINSAIGPDRWRVNNTNCGGNAQSPINILTYNVTYNKDLGTLDLKDYNQKGGNVYFDMKNRNTDIAFVAKVKSGEIPQSVVFKGTTYRFYQFHFHWGSTNFQGSEHLVDSQRYAAEMHMIHYNTKYANISEAIQKSDGLLVWGHFLKVNTPDAVQNTNFKTLLDKFVDAKKCCNVTKVLVNLIELLPKNYKQFYYYKGSLTTPGCFESVTWIVNRNPILVSENEMKLFRQLKDEVMNSEPLVDHFRPTQPLNGRKVQCNFDDTEDENSAGVPIKPSSLAMLTIVAALMLLF